MIPLYLALTKRTSRIHGAKLTLHTITVLELLKQTLEIQYTLEGNEGKPFKATLKPH
jgi:RNA 3'-terminal phosphate cyclase